MAVKQDDSSKKEKTPKINRMLNIISKKITPDYKLMKDVDSTVDAINSLLKLNKIRAVCVKGGSIAKDTFLKNDHDIDLFIRFNSEYKEKDISKILFDAIKDSGYSIAVIHGSRDYFQFTHKNLHYELIPVIMIHPSNYKQAENVTDLSPEHVAWVQSYTNKNPSLNNEIRLTKQFCKANGVYGAESYINGFSGHIIDILVIHYNSFMNLIKVFSGFDEEKISTNNPIIIDHEHHMKNVSKELNDSKRSPLIIIDPIQADRNAAAALNQEKLAIFIKVCKGFIKHPSTKYFIIKKFDLSKEIKDRLDLVRRELVLSHDRGSNKKIQYKTIIIDVETLDGSKDVVGTKVLKVYELLEKHLVLNNFEVLAMGWNFDFEKRSAIIYFILPDFELSETIEHIGPPIISKDALKNFSKMHSDHKTFIRDNRIYAIIPRQYMLAETLLKELFNKEFIKSRIKKISIGEIKKAR